MPFLKVIKTIKSRNLAMERDARGGGRGAGAGYPPQMPSSAGIPQSIAAFLFKYGDILGLGMIALTLTLTFIIMMIACCLCCRHYRRSRKYKIQHKHSLQLQASNGTANSQI